MSMFLSAPSMFGRSQIMPVFFPTDVSLVEEDGKQALRFETHKGAAIGVHLTSDTVKQLEEILKDLKRGD